jgi:BON domain-containing protein
MARRVRVKGGLKTGDVLAGVAGGVLGLAVGFLIAGSVGRVNAHRIKGAVRRWRGRPRAVWSDEEAERLEARVLDALARDVVLARRPIRVAVLGQGLVELTGRVLHASEVGLAGDIVQRTDGVTTVLNHLLIEGADAGVGVPGPRAPRAARR